MEISTIGFQPTISHNTKDSFDLSSGVIDAANQLTAIHQNTTAVIYGDQVTAIDNDILKGLLSDFQGDFSKYQNIVIADNQAKDYLEKITEFVLEDLNVANADKNKDGFISIAESLDTKNTITEDDKIVKARDALPKDVIKEIEKDDSIFMSINDIINVHIQLDTDKDAKVSVEEIYDKYSDLKSQKNGETSDSGGNGSVVAMLYKQLEKIDEMLNTVVAKQKSASSDVSLKVYEAQEQAYMGQKEGIFSKIQTLENERKKKEN